MVDTTYAETMWALGSVLLKISCTGTPSLIDDIVEAKRGEV